MILKKIYCIVIAVILLAGCSTKPDVIAPPERNSHNLTKGTIQTKSVGNYILRRDNLLLYPEFVSDQEIIFPRIAYVSLSPLPAGTKLKVVWKYEDGSFLCEPASGAAIVNKRAVKPFPAGLVIDSNGKLNGFAYRHNPECPLKHEKFTTISFQKTDVITSAPIHSEIVYNGGSNDIVKLLYREFKADTTHPLFQQDLVYDLSASRIIAFKGTKIEVIEAAYSFIRYRVIEGAANWKAN